MNRRALTLLRTLLSTPWTLSRGAGDGTALAPQDTVDKLTYAVEPGLLFGRPGPNKSRWDLDALKRRGLAVVVSLVHIEDPKAVARAV